MESLDKINKDRHILISVHDRSGVRVGFLDNEKPKSLHYYGDSWHRYLTQGSETFDFSVYKTGQDVSMLNEENYVSFRFGQRDHFFKIRKIEETETEITCYCESTNIELLNEEAQPYEATKAMSLVEYLNIHEIIGPMLISNLTLGINEVSSKKLKLSWEGSETKLARLLSLVNSFDAECEFETILNSNGTFQQLKMNVYRKHDDEYQGVGTRIAGKTLYYGDGLDSIRRTVDISELVTAIQPKGSKEVETTTDGQTSKETVEVNLRGFSKPDVYDSDGRKQFYLKNGVIYAPQSMDRFPACLAPDSDKWVKLIWETEYSTQESLYGNALSKLKTLSEPSIEYEIEGDFDLEIGDTVIVHDDKFDPALILEVRVSEQEYCFTDPTKCRNVFSNVKALENKLSSFIVGRMMTLIDEALPVTIDVLIDGATIFKNKEGSATLSGRLMKGEKEVSASSWKWYKDGTQVASTCSIKINASEITGSSVYRIEAVRGGKVYQKNVTMSEVRDGLGISTIKDQYTLSDSTSTNSGSTWSDEPVQYVDGKAVWSRYQITYDDGSVGYTNGVYNAVATIGYQASFRCGELEADNAVIHGSLSAHDAHFTELETDTLNVKERLTAAEGEIGDLTTTTLNVKERLTATEGEITDLTSDNVTVKNRLNAAEGNITDLTTENATVKGRLTAAEAVIDDLDATYASIGDLEAQTGRIDTLSTNLTTAQTLIAQKATITDLDAATGRIALLESGKADIGDLTAVSTKTNTLEAGVANINLLLSGSTVSGSTQTIVLNAQNCTVDTAFFENLISSYVTAGYIFGDTISTNDFTIKSDDGGLEMADKTIQIKDSTRVRIQIGEDSSGNYNLYLWDEDGNLLWDAQGLTATGISRPIIKDSMVADNAGIAGSKLNIPSVVTSINNGTVKIESALVNVDGQSLNVAFNTLETKVDDMEVGGRNLILNSETRTPNPSYGATITGETGVTVSEWNTTKAIRGYGRGGTNVICATIQTGRTSTSVPPATSISGQMYTFSSWIKNNGSNPLEFLLNFRQNKSITIAAGESKRVVLTGEGNGTSNLQINVCTEAAGDAFDFIFYHPKLELGTFATDWTPAPEDVEDKITTQSTQISVIQGQISSLITDVEQLNENKADGSQVTTLTNNYNSLKQTVDGTVNDIGSLQTTIATKADNSTVTTIRNNQNTLSNTVNGLTQRIQSAETTLESKADNSTVTTIQNNYNTLSNTVNGLESSVGTVTTTVNGTIASSITLFYSSDSTTAPALPTSKVTSTATTSKVWTTVVPAFSASYPYLYTCMQQTTVAGNVTWTKAVSGSYANYVGSVNTTANAGIKETVTLFHASATASAPSKPTSAIATSNATTYGAWNKTLPTYSANYPYLYLCTQTLTNGGTYAWTNVESGSYADYISSLSSEQASLKTTVNSITSKVSNLTSAVGANADGSLTTSLTDQISEVRQTASGITSTVSSLQAQVDGIQVGGRNLVIGSSKQAAVTNNTVHGWYKNSNDTTVSQTTIDGVDCFYLSRPSATTQIPTATLSLLGCPRVEPNTTYTYSAWLRFSQDMPNYATSGAPLHYQIRKLTGDDALLFESSGSYANQTYTAKLVEGGGGFVAGEWKRIVIRITIGDLDSSYPYIYFRPFIYGSTDTACTEVWFKGVKLEKGTVATDYTEAPEDIESSITAVQEYASSIDQKADSITSTVSSVQNQLDNLEVGGRNLLQKSKDERSATFPASSGYQDLSWTVSSSGYKISETINAVTGDTYTLSFDAKAENSGAIIWAYFYSPSVSKTGVTSQGSKNTATDGKVAFTLSTEYKRYSVTWTFNEDGTANNLIVSRAQYGNGTGTVYIKNVKLEKGNKPTDWTPAPEDTESDISGLATRVSTAEQKITPDAITLAVNETVSNGTRSLTNGSSFTLTNDTCTIDGAKLIIRGSGKSLEESLDITASGRNLVVDGEFSKIRTNANLTKGSGVFPASWDYYNPGLSNYQNIYAVYIDQDTFGYNVAVFNESDGTRHQKVLSKSIVAGWGFDGSWDHYRLSIDVYATGAGTKLTGGFYYARPEDNGARNFRSGQFSIPSSKISVGEWSRVSVEIPYNHDWNGTSAVTFYLYGYNFSANEILYVKNISINNATVTCDFTRNTGEISVENIYTVGTTTIDGAKITTGSIVASKIAANAITADKLAIGTITSASGVIGSLDAGDIKTGTLSADRIGAKSITVDKLDTKAISVGSRNLILNSATKQITAYNGGGTYTAATMTTTTGVTVSEWGAKDAFTCSGTASSTSNGVLGTLVTGRSSSSNPTSLQLDQEYVGSIYIKNNHATNTVKVYFNGYRAASSEQVVINPGECKRITCRHTGNTTSTYNLQMNFCSGGGASTGYNFTYWHPQIEVGYFASDWTPAPEDVDANIDDAKSMADDAQDTASTALSTASNALTEALTSLDRLDELDPLVQKTVEDASKALANLKTWTKDGTQTMIDGGKIYTGTITADKIYGENLAAIRATLGDVKAGSISSPNDHIKINLYDDNAGIQITNSVLETTLHIDANGTWVTNKGGDIIAQFTSSGTETVDLTATGTSLLSGLKIEKQSAEVWISYGG